MDLLGRLRLLVPRRQDRVVRRPIRQGRVAGRDQQLIVATQRPGAHRHHRLPFSHAFENFGALGIFDPDLHFLEGGLVVLAREIDSAFALGVDQRDFRQNQDVVAAFDLEVDVGIHPRLQPVVAVGDFDFHRRRACGRIQHRRDARNAPVEFLARIRVDFDDRTVTDADHLEILFDDVGDQPQ